MASQSRRRRLSVSFVSLSRPSERLRTTTAPSLAPTTVWPERPHAHASLHSTPRRPLRAGDTRRALVQSGRNIKLRGKARTALLTISHPLNSCRHLPLVCSPPRPWKPAVDSNEHRSEFSLFSFPSASPFLKYTSWLPLTPPQIGGGRIPSLLCELSHHPTSRGAILASTSRPPPFSHPDSTIAPAASAERRVQ